LSQHKTNIKSMLLSYICNYIGQDGYWPFISKSKLKYLLGFFIGLTLRGFLALSSLYRRKIYYICTKW